jgi:rare lipoprotein A (peptidoglycan hydrolase)
MNKIARKAEVDNQNLEPPLARQNLAFSLYGPVALFTSGGIMKLLLTILFVVITTNAYAMQASYYTEESLRREGQWKISQGRMANNEQYDESKLTVATGKQYKFGTYLRVTNIENGKSVVVKVTDRIGKRFAQTRLDLSKAAFGVICGERGHKAGLLPISVEVL